MLLDFRLPWVAEWLGGEQAKACGDSEGPELEPGVPQGMGEALEDSKDNHCLV